MFSILKQILLERIECFVQLRYLVVRTVGQVQSQGFSVEFLLLNKLQHFREMVIP